VLCPLLNGADVTASKILADETGKPWIWLQKIKEHYIGASTLRQDKQTKPQFQHAKPQYALPPDAVLLADEFMKEKFLFGLNESFSCF